MGDLQIEKGIFRLNGEFANRKRDFLVKCGICEEKMCDFRVKWGIVKKKTRFLRKCGISEEKTCDFRLNGGFLKRKRLIFA